MTPVTGLPEAHDARKQFTIETIFGFIVPPWYSLKYQIIWHKKTMKVGCARVSSNNQDLELQTQELLKAGCKKVH